MRQKIDKSSGFTLIEVLIAAVILTFGLLAMATFLGSLVSKNSGNERRTMATLIAQDKVEDLRGLALKNDISSADNSTDTVTTQAGTFNRAWTIVEDFVGLSDEVTVVVTWDGTSQGATQYTLRTLIND